MQTQNRLFDDLAKVASGAFNTLGGLRDEIEMRVRERVERMANEMDLVNREDLEAVRAVAQKARSEQEALSAKIEELQAELAALKGERPGAGFSGVEAGGADEEGGDAGGSRVGATTLDVATEDGANESASGGKKDDYSI